MSELRELDAQVATQIMNWQNVQHQCFTPYGQDTCGDDPANDGRGFNGTNRKAVPLYSSNIAQAFKVEDRVAELGLIDEYAYALEELVGLSFSSSPAHQIWGAAHASPEQRCRAALECVKEKAKAASS